MDDDGSVQARPPSTTARALAPLTAVAAVFVVLAAIAVPWALRAGADKAGTSQTRAGEPRALPAEMSEGVPVEGAGTLLKYGKDTRLCAAVAVTLSLPPSSASCGGVWVRVTGVPKRWFNNTTTEGQAFSDPVFVEGSYHGGTLEVNQVRRAGQPDEHAAEEPKLPCPAPLGGWLPGRGFASQEAENAAAERLQAALAGGREHYTEAWEAHPADAGVVVPDAPSAVMVAGTTGDLVTARAELGRIYGGNLCVHRVRFAAADLERIAQRLREAAPGRIDAQPAVVEGRVRVQVVALDPSTVALLDKVDRAAVLLEEPMLQWLD
jgi:hypothetical protein